MLRYTCLLLLAVVAACGPAVTEDLDVTGDWTEEWSCEETCNGTTDTVTGTTEMTLLQTGTEVAREDADGTSWSGTLSGNVLTLSTDDGTYSEDSTLTFDGAGDTFTVESAYESPGCTGTCTGTGTRG